MTSLGERLTAQRDAMLKANAPTPPHEIAAVVGDAVKTYVDERIAQIITENSLVAPVPETPPLVIPVTDAVTVTITTDSDGLNVVSTDTAPVEAPPAEQ